MLFLFFFQDAENLQTYKCANCVAWGRQSEDYECGKHVLFEGWCTEHAFSVATSVSALCQL